MRQHFATLFLVSALALAAANARADGIDDYASRHANAHGCGGGNFSGMYVGGHLGYGDHDIEVDDLNFGTSLGGSDETVTGGVHSGYNLQCGHVVFGIESDFNFFDSSASGDEGTISHTSSIDWFGTLRGRLGFVHNNEIMIYLTAGLAHAEIDHHLTDSSFSYSRHDEDTQYGWTVGGGIEFFRHDRWTMRAEGLYVDFGDENHEYTADFCGFSCSISTKWTDELWIARIGLSYKFGARQPEYIPMK